MYRLTLRSVPRSSIVTRSTPRTAPAVFARNKSAHSTNTSQGHAVNKSSSTLHKDKDVQSAAARAAKHERTQAESGSQAAGFDAARQGGQTGEAKGGAEGTGALKDQVGGQPGGTPGKKEGKQDAPSAGGTMASQLKNALGMDDRKPGARGYHTSTRFLAPKSPREPKETSLPSEQNPHLKHKEPGDKDSSERDATKARGNAADTPHLPSKSAASSVGSTGLKGGAPGTKKGFATSARATGKSGEGRGYAKALDNEPTKEGFNVPPTALPSNLESPYKDATQPPPPGLKPSSSMDHSSTATGTPNEVLAKGAREGTLADRNVQPTAEAGRQGLDEAWKHRK
ncbi:hypothetical protein JCM24511_06264 [Saitozyma sp. JCM 24511]|nr:hypothetical protein JCM24511_06264 [Saitozyma sp. JCM 24511]